MRVPLTTILREWGRIGTIGFGGPPAHIALLRELMIDRRGWMTAREFEDANATCQLLPGPASTQMSIYCAWALRGAAGAMIGGLAFILPGLLITLAIAAVALQDDPPAWVSGIGQGAAAAVVAVVAQAGLQLGVASLREPGGASRARALAYALAGAVATVTAGPYVLGVLLACGLIELLWRRHGTALVLFAVALPELPPLAWTALKVGGLSFGGGFVTIPLMRADSLDHGWLTAEQFANAIAYGQVTPGPVTHTVALVGWGAAGLAGAALASVIAFAPSFLFVMLGGRHFRSIRERPGPRRFLDGAGPAAIGAIVGAALVLARDIGEPWQWAVLAAAALALALRAQPILVLLGGASAGLISAL